MASAQPDVSPAEVKAKTPRAGRDLTARGRWLVAVIAAVLVHASAFLLFGVNNLTSAHHPPARPGLSWAGGRVAPESTFGEVALHDSTPLFLPTMWNAASRELSLQEERSPLEIFPTDPPQLSVAEGRRPEALRVFPPSESDAGEYVSRFAWPPLAAFGRADPTPAVRAPARLARIEVRSLEDGSLAWARDVAPAEAPDPSAWPEWQPMEMLVVVDAARMIGAPLLVRTSGSESVDEFFERHVEAELRPGLTLPAGYYRVLIGP